MNYTFKNPGKVRIRVRASDQEFIVDTSTLIWSWRDGGTKFTIDWSKLDLHPTLKEAAKAFVVYRLQSNSPVSVYSNEYNLLKAISAFKYRNIFPWSEIEASSFLNERLGTKEFINFRVFYKWCVKRQIPGFSKEIEIKLSEKSGRDSSYKKIHLGEVTLSADDEYKILQTIEGESEHSDYVSFRNNVILHLGFELAPRPIQIFCLDETDLESYSVDENIDYFTLWLPMAKKRSAALPEKRPRRITKALGNKIKSLAKLNKIRFKNNSDIKALFLTDDGLNRLPTARITTAVTDKLKALGFNKGDGLTMLRHHLGQSLADQGASAETIAEILGHNSTLPARSYIAATPEIGTIKTKALGKNATYINIMKMMLTGEMIERSAAPKERWVKGLVGSQYIGGVGSCGLSNSTPCPKNPVYSCYTCNKFHPFVDGSHDEVRSALERQAQFFIDTATSAMEIENNRAVSQLELTIQAVDAVINRASNK
ncbi:MAG: site-specific integrase [Bacteroidetes bacterium]|nr:site-specific integrase [Bacteroidota bacterium]